MPEFTIDPQVTPNPNVMKFVTHKTLNPYGAKAYYHPDEVHDDPAAAALFAIEGVAGVMILNEFCIANKSESASWDDLVPKIEAVMREHWE